MTISYAHSATIEYEITSISSSGKIVSITKGKKEYSTKDILIEEKSSSEGKHWSKTLPLEKGFRVGASIYREQKLTGFGIWGEIGGCKSFSWEWFDLEKPGVFSKLQEGGLVSVSYQGLPMYEEISEISFNTNISLRINNSDEVGKVTHRVLIRKGSVLKFAP